MRNDKEFKAKNRDESYVKDKRPDIQLGRHTEGEKQKPPLTPSKKNRMYRARQAENTAANSENVSAETKIDISVSKTADNNVPVPADSTAQFTDKDIEQNETENISQDIQPLYSSAAKKKKYRSKMYRIQKQIKSVDYNFAEQAQKSDDYDISEKAQENKTEFSKNTDMDFSESKSERDSNIPFDSVRDTKSETDKKPNSKKRQKLSFDKSDKSDNAESDAKTNVEKTDTPKSDSGDIPFDRVNRCVEKFEEKAEKAKSKAEKAEQNLPHKRKIKRKRLYDEQKQKPKNRLQFEKEVKPQSDLYHRSPIKTSREALQHTALNKLHSKVAEVENENTGVEAAHQTEQKAESLAQYSVRTAKYIDGQRKVAPYKKAARLKVKAEKAEIKAAYEKTLAENPSLKKSALKKFRQKQQIIPGEALTDETFRKLITEAEKYLGYPYVWGGSSPQTSFDCSGFVCWVFKNSGVYPLGRTTAQGIFDLCTPVRPSDEKPGDIIFFTGTYNGGCPVSHVGIYVGNGMMIHCGNPIQYASVNSNYWTQHFYAYGRLN